MDRQKQILSAFEGNKDLILKKSEIKQKGKIIYYRNTSKYLGETLSRMVKNGTLLRVKLGHYKLHGIKPSLNIDSKEQLKLF